MKSYTQKTGSRFSVRLLNEGPEVIGTVTAVLENGGSVDSAVREVSERGPPVSSKLFREIVYDADLRVESDMFTAVSRMISSLPEECASYGLALRMAMSAADISDRSERSRVLKDASDIILNGLRESGKTFAASLNAPCMAVFGLGIMIPMVLMSILPMMSLSGMFGSGSMDIRSIAVVTLVLIPSAILLMVSGINRKNPVSCRGIIGNPALALPLLSAIPLFAILCSRTGDPVDALCISVIGAGMLTLVAGLPAHRAESRRSRTEREIECILIELGNRMVCGAPFESALCDSLLSRRSLSGIAIAFRNEITVCRGDIDRAITNVFSPVSRIVTGAMCDIYRTSVRDLADAGKLAISLGRQLNDRQLIRRNIRNELKGMTDTMFGTAAFFAPLVLGLSVSMLEPIKHLASDINTGLTTAILSVYLCELSAIISLLLSFIEGRCDVGTIVRRFAMISMVSLAVFAVTLNISF